MTKIKITKVHLKTGHTERFFEMAKLKNFLVIIIFIINTTKNGFSLPDEIYGANVHWRPTGTNSVRIA